MTLDREAFVFLPPRAYASGSPSNAATSFETRAWSRTSASTRRGVAVDTLEGWFRGYTAGKRPK